MNKLESIILEGVAVGKPVYALCSVSAQNRLKAHFYSLMIEGGSFPLWGVWSMHGRFKRFFVKRSAVEQAHKKYVWRRMSARLTLVLPVVDQPHSEEVAQLVDHYEGLKTRKKDKIVQLKRTA